MSARLTIELLLLYTKSFGHFLIVLRIILQNIVCISQYLFLCHGRRRNIQSDGERHAASGHKGIGENIERRGGVMPSWLQISVILALVWLSMQNVMLVSICYTSLHCKYSACYVECKCFSVLSVPVKPAEPQTSKAITEFDNFHIPVL